MCAASHEKHRPEKDDGTVLYQAARLELERGQAQAAVRLLEQLLTKQPANVAARHDLAMALAQLADYETAIIHMQEAQRLRPHSGVILNNLGGLLEEVGRLEDAMECYRQASECEPAQAAPHLNVGEVLRKAGRLDEAVLPLRVAATLDPNAKAAWAALGATLVSIGQTEGALGALRRVIELAPDDACAHQAWADALRALGRWDEAITAYQAALRLNAQHADTWFGLGQAQLDAGRAVEAIESFQQCTQLDPRHFPGVHNLAKALFRLGCIEDATSLLRQALEFVPDELRTHALLSLAVLVPGNPSDNNATILQTRRAWAQCHSRDTRHRPIPAIHPAQRVRIGYVSAFFDRPNWMKPVWGLLNHHDRQRFAVHVFSDASIGAIGSGYQLHPDDRYHDTSGQSNEAVAAVIRAQNIDILIDLNGFSAPPRLGIYPLRPAPILVAWFNMYATSGMDCFDYLIGDQYVVPPEEEPFYAERILRVPHSYLTFEVGYHVPDIAPQPLKNAGCFTFGCLASQYKITDQVVRTWSQILRRSPSARLLIRNHDLGRAEHQGHLHARFAKWDIASDRLLLLGPADHFEFLRTYDQIDLALDPFPYSGGTTTMEALWQGVPVVTFDGDRWASRTSVSLLMAAGLSEYVGRSVDDYVGLCVSLATAPTIAAALQEFRAQVRPRLQQSPVCDTASFARAMEDLYLKMLSTTK